jgi:ElaB/YqjD/DUF883 family membrane-anchored ribosome-binding protein
MSATEKSADKIAADLKQLVRDSEELLLNTAGDLGEKADEARQRLTDALQAARSVCGKLEGTALEGVKCADSAIRSHPYQSVGVAVGIGILIGALVTRK